MFFADYAYLKMCKFLPMFLADYARPIPYLMMCKFFHMLLKDYAIPYDVQILAFVT